MGAAFGNRHTGWVDGIQPVELLHPLVRNMACWYGVPPGWGAGLYVSDLLAPYDARRRAMLRDSAGNNTGAVKFADGPNGWNSLEFDGSGNSMLGAPNVKLGSTKRMSIATWALFHAQSSYVPIFESRAVNLAGLLLSGVSSGSQHYLTASWDGGAGEYNGGPGGLLPNFNEWTFCAATFDAAATTLTAYMASASKPLKWGTVAIPDAAKDHSGLWYVGYDSGSAATLNGHSTNQRIWHDRVLTPAEMQAVYEDDLAGNPETIRWRRPWSNGVTVEAAPGGDSASGNLLLLGVG